MTMTSRYVDVDDVDEPIVRPTCTSMTLPTTGANELDYHRNQQYSIIGLTNAAGTLVERYSYTAYGTLGIYDASGTVRTTITYANRYTYTGREYDADLNLYHFRARWYDPATGGFISRDPLGYVDGMSLYRGYFGVKMLDPSGLSTVRWTTGAGGPKDVGENAVCCLRAEVFWKENGFVSEGECYSECTGWVTTGATAVAGAGGIFEAYLGRSPHASVAIGFFGLGYELGCRSLCASYGCQKIGKPIESKFCWSMARYWMGWDCGYYDCWTCPKTENWPTDALIYVMGVM